MAFPDVDPSFIARPPQGYYQNEKSLVSRRAELLEEVTDSFERPHLWYSTSEVVHALELFIASGDELSGSNTYRLALSTLEFNLPTLAIYTTTFSSL